MIDLTFRCFSRNRWLAVAENRGILAVNTDDPSGYSPTPGFAVDEIGNIEVSPGVFDPWWTVNVRVFGSKAAEDADDVYPGENSGVNLKFIRSKLVRFIREQATPVTLTYKGNSIRAYQFGTTTNRVQILDPRDWAAIRPRVWCGGMED